MMKIGLLKEKKVPEDKRVVLTPKQCKRIKVTYPEVELVVQSSEIRCFSDSQYISDSCFFQALGFAESKTMDYSDYEFADYILDLNDKKAVLDELCEAFDVIIDSGEIEDNQAIKKSCCDSFG